MSRPTTPRILEIAEELWMELSPNPIVFNSDLMTHSEEFKREVYQWLREEESFYDEAFPVPEEIPIEPSNDLDVLREFFVLSSDNTIPDTPSSSYQSSSSSPYYGEFPQVQDPFPSMGIVEMNSPYYLPPSSPIPTMMPSSYSPFPLYTAPAPKQKAIRHCVNCLTQETSLWRKNGNGDDECNACNIYESRNGCKRPIDLHKKKILNRKRKPRHKVEQPTAIFL